MSNTDEADSGGGGAATSAPPSSLSLPASWANLKVVPIDTSKLTIPHGDAAIDVASSYRAKKVAPLDEGWQCIKAPSGDPTHLIESYRLATATLPSEWTALRPSPDNHMSWWFDPKNGHVHALMLSFDGDKIDEVNMKLPNKTLRKKFFPPDRAELARQKGNVQPNTQNGGNAVMVPTCCLAEAIVAASAKAASQSSSNGGGGDAHSRANGSAKATTASVAASSSSSSSAASSGSVQPAVAISPKLHFAQIEHIERERYALIVQQLAVVTHKMRKGEIEALGGVFANASAVADPAVTYSMTSAQFENQDLPDGAVFAVQFYDLFPPAAKIKPTQVAEWRRQRLESLVPESVRATLPVSAEQQDNASAPAAAATPMVLSTLSQATPMDDVKAVAESAVRATTKVGDDTAKAPPQQKTTAARATNKKAAAAVPNGGDADLNVAIGDNKLIEQFVQNALAETALLSHDILSESFGEQYLDKHTLFTRAGGSAVNMMVAAAKLATGAIGDAERQKKIGKMLHDIGTRSGDFEEGRGRIAVAGEKETLTGFVVKPVDTAKPPLLPVLNIALPLGVAFMNTFMHNGGYNALQQQLQQRLVATMANHLVPRERVDAAESKYRDLLAQHTDYKYNVGVEQKTLLSDIASLREELEKARATNTVSVMDMPADSF